MAIPIRGHFDRRACCVVLFLALAQHLSIAQEHDPALQKAFVKGIRTSYDTVDKLAFRVRFTKTDSLTKKEIVSYEHAMLGDGFALKEFASANGTKVVHSRNKGYAFAVEPEKTNLTFLQQIQGGDLSTVPEIESQELVPKAFSLANVYLWHDSLHSLIQQRQLQIHKVFRVNHEGKNLVHVDFSYEAQTTPKWTSKVDNGYLLCDPEREWTLVKYGGELVQTFEHHVAEVEWTVDIQSENEVEGFPFASRVEKEYQVESYPIDDESKRHKDTLKRQVEELEILAAGDDVSEADFYLASYGLPEPNFERSRAWLYPLILGSIALVVGFLIVRRRKND